MDDPEKQKGEPVYLWIYLTYNETHCDLFVFVLFYTWGHLDKDYWEK